MRRNGEDVSQMQTALEVARRAGDIAAVVAGELHRTPHEYLLTLLAVSAVDNRVLRTAVAGGMDQSVLLAATEREAALVREVMEQLAPEPLDPLPPVTTSSLTALRFFAQGVAVADSILSAQAGGWPKSLELFRSALEEDPEFAMAQVWLAMGMKFAEETELSYRGGTRAPPIHFRQHALESLALADRGFVSERERLFIQGVATMLLERPDEAIAAFETLLSTDSRFFELRTRSLLASIYATEARWPERRAQVLRLAQLVPNDVDVNVAAAEELILQDGGNVRGASVFVERARQHIVPEVAQRENTCWSVAWLEHLPVYESWVGGDTADAAMKLRALASQLNSRVAADRDAMATGTGYLWLTLGRVADARKAFEAVGHVGQRERNLALLADLLDDRASMMRHLERQGWGYNPVPFARAGLVERARQIMKDPTVTGERKAQDAIAKAEPMIGTGRPREAIELLQPAIDMLRARPARGVL